MNKLDFKTYVINEKQHIELLNNKNVELFLLASTALSYLVKMEEDEAVMKDGNLPELIGYIAWSNEKISNLSTSKDINTTTPELVMITRKLRMCLGTANQALRNNPSKLKIGDFNKEFWWFFSEVIYCLLDNVKILKSEHKKIKGQHGIYSHNIRVKFDHGDNSWSYNVRLKDNEKLSVQGFMNGVALDIEQKKESLAKIPEELIAVNLALKNIASSIAMDKSFEFLCDIANKDRVIVSKAKTIALILGGSYNNYLLSVKHFQESLTNVLRDSPMDEYDASRYILNKQLRVEDYQIDQIISVLNPHKHWS